MFLVTPIVIFSNQISPALLMKLFLIKKHVILFRSILDIKETLFLVSQKWVFGKEIKPGGVGGWPYKGLLLWFQP